MKTILSFISLLVLIGCGKGPNTIDPAFQGYYDSYIKDANINGMNLDTNQGLTVQFDNLNPDLTVPVQHLGVCDNVGYGNSTIRIDSHFWVNTVDESFKKIVIYHEFSHCLIARIHVPDTNDIMYPYANVVIDNYNRNPVGLIAKLFR